MKLSSKENISEILNTESGLGDNLVSFALLGDMERISGRSAATLIQEVRESNAVMIARFLPAIRITLLMTLGDKDFSGDTVVLISKNIWMN